MIIKVLGTWCPKCKLLEEVTRRTIAKLWIDAQILKVDKIEDIMEYNILSTPALVLNEEVLCMWRVPNDEEMESIFVRLQ